jgi:Skp family chaperone for outer membrane proteins
MNRTLSLVSALGAGLLSATLSVSAQSSTPAPAAPAATAPARVAPEAIPAKIALIAFEQSVLATNEGQKAVMELQKKYLPKKTQIDALGEEVDSLKKQLQSAPATLSDEERASRLKNIDVKEKQLNRDSEDATAAYNADLQDIYTKIATKVNVTMRKYVAEKGFTLLLDVSGQQSPILWAVPQTDVTEAVIAEYNTVSGIAPPPPSAPSATRPRPSTGPRPKASSQN